MESIRTKVMRTRWVLGGLLSWGLVSGFTSAREAEAAGSQATFYVSPGGNDGFAGTTQDKPFASLAKARDAARAVAGKEAVTVQVADGVYYLPETLTFTPEDSGSAAHPIVYRAEHEGGAVLSGGALLTLDWQPYRDGIFQAKTPQGLEIDQLFIDGAAQRMARYPNYDPKKKTAAYQGYAADAFSKERAANWADPAGGYIHAMHTSRWGGYHYRITGKDAKGNVTYEGGWQNNRQMGMHKDYRMVENIFEELDAPGEWFHDAKTSTLYYMPVAGADVSAAKVEVVRLRHLVEFQGTQASPVKFVTLQGFTVRHAARTFMDCKEPLLRSDWAIYRGGAFLLTGTEDVSVLDCEFDQVGGNAVFVNNYNRRVKVAGCHIHDAGASGVCFVGDPKAVRDPLFEYNKVQDLSKIDRTPGPKTDNYPADSVVEDCLIHGIGRVERQPAGVQISMAQGITVRDVSIYDCARAGINVSEGTWGGHLIEGCDVFDTVLETHDHGSFNSWGRDRFWHKNVEVSQVAIDKEPGLPFLDAVETTVIRNSRWRCDHGWDIDLDDGSSNYDIYNNLLLASGLKLREGFRRHAWNNVMVNNGLHPHVWYKGSKDQVYSNILMRPHRPARIKRENAASSRVDRNFFFVDNSAAVETVSGKFGWDENSVFGDPQFVDPARGDFRVQTGSPALAAGFKNFPMDRYGVKKPSLRKIARTPQLPAVRVAAAKPASAPSKAKPARTMSIQSVWLGAVLKALEGEAFSAYGVGKDEGGVVLLKVPEHSEAARRGLLEGDLVQQINGKPVRTEEALLQACTSVGNAPITLKLVRNQTASEKVISQHAWVETESAATAEGFEKISLARSTNNPLNSNPKTNNDPLYSLVDGKLSQSYGPVFNNGVETAAYKMNLGRKQPVTAINSWTHAKGRRGAQRVTLYGSNSETDPGWDLAAWRPIGSIDTRGIKGDRFSAASLRAADGEALGEFQWILWQVAPVSAAGGGEHSAFQELQVEWANEASTRKGRTLPTAILLQSRGATSINSIEKGEASESTDGGHIATQTQQIIACVGDSNTQRGYPKILQQKLGAEWKAVNCGISAATILDGTLRPFHKMEQYNTALGSKANVIIIMLGTNDANPRWWDAKRKTAFDGPPAAEFKAGYLKLIKDLQAMDSKPQLLLAIPLPVFPERAKPANQENTEGRRANLVNKVIPLIREVAAETKLPLVDIHGYLSDSESLSTDGVHFNNAGDVKMCEALADAVKKLKQPEAPAPIEP